MDGKNRWMNVWIHDQTVYIYRDMVESNTEKGGKVGI